MWNKVWKKMVKGDLYYDGNCGFSSVDVKKLFLGLKVEKCTDCVIVSR